MAVYITDPNALQKLGEVEGTTWRTMQLTDNGPLSFNNFKRAYEANVARHLPLGAIYGDGGTSRYMIGTDGELVFYNVRATAAKIAAARAAGFKIGNVV